MVVRDYSELPFTAIALTQNSQLRTFRHDVDDEELKWHRDFEDRSFIKISGAGWLLQMEDQLPLKIEADTTYFVPRGTWHRVIKLDTATDLTVKLEMFDIRLNKRASHDFV